MTQPRTHCRMYVFVRRVLSRPLAMAVFTAVADYFAFRRDCADDNRAFKQMFPSVSEKMADVHAWEHDHNAPVERYYAVIMAKPLVYDWRYASDREGGLRVNSARTAVKCYAEFAMMMIKSHHMDSDGWGKVKICRTFLGHLQKYDSARSAKDEEHQKRRDEFFDEYEKHAAGKPMPLVFRWGTNRLEVLKSVVSS